MLKIASLYFGAVAYSVVRYIVFAPTNLENLPVFVVNKGISMGAAFCFALAFWHQWRLRGASERPETVVWLRADVFGAFAHVPMSSAILRPGYFREFFAGDRLSFNGEAVLLFGALTAGGIYMT